MVVWVCWSVPEYVKTSERESGKTHIQNPFVDHKTLCGISTLGTWDFDFHTNYDGITCLRCLKRCDLEGEDE